MTSPLRTWIWFALVCAVILAAAGWMGATVWEQDAREQRTGAEALWEQKVQAALWRMDAAASAIVAREAARRPEEVAELARNPGNAGLQARSEGLAKETQAAKSGPAGPRSQGSRQTAAAPEAAAAKADAAPVEESKKAAFRYFNRAEGKVAKAEAPAKEPAAPADRFKLPTKGGGLFSNPSADEQIQTQQTNSYAQRSLANKAFSTNYAQPEPAKDARDHAGSTGQNLLAASAEDGDIVLSRRIESPRRDLVQGVRLDAEAIAAELLPLARVDFPLAQLRPEPDPQAHSARTLAAMPLRFFPGEEPVVVIGSSPVRSAVAAAGAALLVALGAVALLLARTLALSQRRAEFVSTMTHELRTPLTTFRLYTDLLEAAPETADRTRYTHVLAREAERLSHLVENVLAYARLENGKKKPQPQAMTVEELLAPMQERLRERAGRAGFTLEEHGTDAALRLRVHPATVEQILLNLVDNAGKYAASAADKRLVLAVEAGTAGAVTLSLRDFGPGLDPSVKKRLFTPFSRSDRQAAGGVPGVGLGLALCRRLARDMGGDLRHRDADPGAAFALSLARAG